MFGFKTNGLADLTDRLAVGLLLMLVILFGIGALVAHHFKGALAL